MEPWHVVERIGANPISVLVLIALWLVAARSASLVLGTPKPEVKRRSDRKEVHMNGKLVAGSLLETAWDDQRERSGQYGLPFP
jgi:hypothetical protein